MQDFEIANVVVGEIKTAIEKQIPQKPTNVVKVSGDIEKAACPRCRYSFPDIGGISEYYGQVEMYSYCPECGQRINWKEN